MIKAIYAFDWLISVCSFVCSSNRWPFSTMCSLSILSSGIKCDAVHIIDWETYVCTIFRSNIVVTISFFFFPSFQWASFFFVFCVSCHQMSTEKEENAKKSGCYSVRTSFFPVARVLVHERRFLWYKTNVSCAYVDVGYTVISSVKWNILLVIYNYNCFISTT